MFWQRKVTKREVVPCKACDGTGLRVPNNGNFEYTSKYTFDQVTKLAQGICIACNGQGEQQRVWTEYV